MVKFIKYYALEIYTVLSMILLVVAGVIGDLSVIQKFVLVYTFLFILHEWEEMKYPGGFAESIAEIIEFDLTESYKRASRIYTSILLLAFTLTPFFAHQYPITILPLAFLGVLEGIVHIVAIKIFRCPKPYSPGMVTAELQFATSIALFVYLIQNNVLVWSDYLIGLAVMLCCFVIMQKCITNMIGMKYSDVPKKIGKRLFQR